MEQLSERVKRLRTSRGFTQSELAQRLGVAQSTIANIEIGRNATTKVIVKLANVLGVSPEGLQFGENSARAIKASARKTVAEYSSNFGDKIPVISWVQAGKWTEIQDGLEPNQAEEWLPCPVNHGPNAYILRVKGVSMENPGGRPSFSEGDLIFVDPDKSPEHRSLVVVRLDDDPEATFKQLLIEGPKRYLRALNPAWPTPVVEINGHTTMCGVVIFKGEKI